ncbi:serine hydrolase domain-containing protein [Pelomonas sp. SE-A7]|uniref:serine hydrolase domain-containing protein n=1 Tax=Pelomonas sp. SE-A7 TaxID=3054953 RepID=UPI00259C8237|nr:serine hydrolase domain-containing protein [Pelomonas sp. SE-A7]MDM4764563.1 serine hydrolase domain-containing protein [Pelomonas sp. SE-A7]
MRKPQISTALLLALLAAAAQAGQPATPAAMAAYADKLLDEQKINREGPGITVLVARGDQLLYKSARGMASIELGVPMQPDQLMRIGSVTKQFAAATLLKQIDEGKARLDDPLSKFLPDYPNGGQITLLQLLNHTSGVKSYTGIPGYMSNPIRRALSTGELIKEFKDLPADFAPGQAWAYNNSGYVLLGAVVEAISGKTWHQQLTDSLLAPQQLGSVFFQAEDRLFKGMAQGYTLNDKRELAPAGLLSMTQPHAAGALIGNTEALWRWNLALHGGKLISAANYQRMVTPEGPAKPRNYGFGIGTGTVRGQALLSHGGGIHGFVSTLNYLPQTQTTVVILRNSDGPGFSMDLVARKLAAFAIGEPIAEPVAVAVAAEQLKALEGVYGPDERQTRSVRVVDGVLTSQRSGGSPVKLIALGGDRFAVPQALTLFQFDRDAGGKAVALRVMADGEGEGDRSPRRGDLPAESAAISLTPAQLQALLGEYSSPQFSIKLFVDDKGLLLSQAPGQPAIEMKAVSPRLLRTVGVDATLEFSDEEGRAASLTLKQGPAQLKLLRKN